MHEFNEVELKAMLVASVRLAIHEALDGGYLPVELARVLKDYPDAMIETFVDQLMPVIKQQNPYGNGDTVKALAAAASNLSDEEVMRILMSYASKVQPLKEVDQDLDGALLFCSRGDKMLQTERYKEAKAFFRRALEVKGSLRQAWLGLAEAHEHLGEIKEALEARHQAERY